MMNCTIKKVEQSNANRSQFRAVARNSCGETFEPVSTDLIFFASCQREVVAVGSCQPADVSVCEPTPPSDVDSGFAHIINYVFVMPRSKRQGYGTALVKHMEAALNRMVAGRPYRLQASRQAVRFFEKLDYMCVGEPLHPVCPGSMRFSELYTMQKALIAK